MIVNLLQREQSKMQGAAPICAGNDRSLAAGSRLQEGFNLRAQWFDVLHFQDARLHSWPGTYCRRWRLLMDAWLVV